MAPLFLIIIHAIQLPQIHSYVIKPTSLASSVDDDLHVAKSSETRTATQSDAIIRNQHEFLYRGNQTQVTRNPFGDAKEVYEVMEGSFNAAMDYVDDAQDQVGFWQIRTAVFSPGDSSFVLGVMKGSFKTAKQYVDSASDHLGLLQVVFMKKLAISEPGESSLVLGLIRGAFAAAERYASRSQEQDVNQSQDQVDFIQVGLVKKNTSNVSHGNASFVFAVMQGSFNASKEYMKTVQSDLHAIQNIFIRQLAFKVADIMDGSFDAAMQHVETAQGQVSMSQNGSNVVLDVMKGSLNAAFQYIDSKKYRMLR